MKEDLEKNERMAKDVKATYQLDNQHWQIQRYLNNIQEHFELKSRERDTG